MKDKFLSTLYMERDDSLLESTYKDCLSMCRDWVDKAFECWDSACYLKRVDILTYCVGRYLYETTNENDRHELIILENQDIFDTRIYEIERLKFVKIFDFKYLEHNNHAISILFKHRLFYIDFESASVITEPTHVYGLDLLERVYYAHDVFSLDTVALDCIRGDNIGFGYRFLEQCWNNTNYVYSGNKMDKIKEHCFAYLCCDTELNRVLDAYFYEDSVTVSTDSRYICKDRGVIDVSRHTLTGLYYFGSYRGIFSGLSRFGFSFDGHGLSGDLMIDSKSGLVFLLKHSSDITTMERYASLSKVEISTDKAVYRKLVLQ